MADVRDGKPFLQRWSERKLDADRAVADTDLAALPDTPDERAEVQPLEVQAQTPPADLPDVETLDADSDYTGFLGENVPEDLAKMALRKLWRSDPVLANIDGLNDYDADFSKVGMVSEVVKTVYKVGSGYLSAEDEAEDIPDSDDVGNEDVVHTDGGGEDVLVEVQSEDGLLDSERSSAPDEEQRLPQKG